MSSFEIKDGRIVLELNGTELQILDTMAHRFPGGINYYRDEDVSAVKSTLCDAVDSYYVYYADTEFGQ